MSEGGLEIDMGSAGRVSVCLASATCLGLSSPIQAKSLVLTAGLYFQSLSGPNYFDPAFGYVPAGSGNVNSSSLFIDRFQTLPKAFNFNDGANNDYINVVNSSLVYSTLQIDIIDNGRSTAYPFYITLFSTLGIFARAGLDTSAWPGATITFYDQGRSAVFYSPGSDKAINRSVRLTFGYSDFGGFPFATRLSAVPEPATWMMMIFGVAGTGAILRGQKRRQRALLIAA